MSRSQTDEKLRYYLNANQGARERFVADILPQLGPYMNCKPLRPDGGPDGGVDIIAELNNGEGSVLIAVGFKNNAGPPMIDLPWICKKFRFDLTQAKESINLGVGFVFVTNVDLTPKTRIKLRTEAIENGYSHVEIYDREQLRLALDKPEGFFIRLRYLDIPMTIEDQYRMLAAVGNEISQLTVKIQSIESQMLQSNLQRTLESKVRNIGWTFSLEKLNLNNKGEHAFLLVLPGLAETEPFFAILQEFTISEDLNYLSTSVWLWNTNIEEEILLLSTSQINESSKSQKTISMMIDIPFKEKPSIYNVIRSNFRVFASSGISKNVTSMSLVINELLIVDTPIPALGAYPATAQPLWSKDSPVRFKSSKWKALAVTMIFEIYKAAWPRPQISTYLKKNRNKLT